MKTTRLFTIICLIGFFLMPLSGWAQLSLNGYTKGSVYGAGEQFDFTSVFGELSLVPDYKLGQTYVHADVRFRKGTQFGEELNQFQVKEAYAAFLGDKFDLSLGNQIVKWGRTDGFNPTNNLTSNDYFLLSADPDDQLLGTFMLKMNYRFTPVIELELVGIPFYTPSIYRYDLFSFGETASFGQATLPSQTFENASLAARLDFNLPAVGFSLSWFQGYDPFYGFNVSSVDWSSGYPMISYSASPYHKKTLGADFAVPLSSFIIRGEVAWNQTEKELNDIHIPNSNLSYVGGIEAQFAGITAIAQYVGKYDLDFMALEEPSLLDPTNPMLVMDYTQAMILFESAKYNRNIFNQTEEFNHGLLLSINKSFGYDLVNLELSGYYLITTEEYLIRPKVSFRLSDGLNLAVGGQYMAGPDKAVFDYAGKIMSGGFLELKASF